MNTWVTIDWAFKDTPSHFYFPYIASTESIMNRLNIDSYPMLHIIVLVAFVRFSPPDPNPSSKIRCPWFNPRILLKTNGQAKLWAAKSPIFFSCSGSGSRNSMYRIQNNTCRDSNRDWIVLQMTCLLIVQYIRKRFLLELWSFRKTFGVDGAQYIANGFCKKFWLLLDDLDTDKRSVFVDMNRGNTVTMWPASSTLVTDATIRPSEESLRESWMYTGLEDTECDCVERLVTQRT
jgi:hypothetical protein